MSGENEQYQSYLQSLDDSQLLDHIRSLSQSQQKVQAASFEDTSTPVVNKETHEIENLSAISFASVSSDPFDDGLDDVLANLEERNDIKKGNEVKGNDSYERDEIKSLSASQVKDFDSNSSDDEEYDIGKVHEFGDYTTYFRHKQQKQQQNDEEYVTWDLERRKTIGDQDIIPRKPIFEGCSIHVNGYTNPSISEIHRLVILHGGKFLSYLVNKGAATHIICDRLTPRKIIQFKNYKVVRAQWIVDSISKKRLLDWKDYRLIQDVDYGQKRLNFGGLIHDSIPESKQDDADIIESGQGYIDNHTNENDGEEYHDINEKNYIDSESEKDNKEEFGDLPPLTQPEDEEDEENGSRIEYFHEMNNLKEEPERKSSVPLDAKHPDFLKHFFANSRLHHLSSWKADLRLKFLKRIVNEIKSSEQNNHKNTGETIIFHIDFDCFFATASSLNHPHIDIHKDPIAVSHGGRTSDVSSCNYVARKYGVKNGMWVGGAKRLCPNLICLDYDFEAYEKYSNQFYDYLISLKIFDTIFPVSIDEVLVDVSSYCASKDVDVIETVNTLADKIRKDIFDLTFCPVSIGMSHNVLLAKLALRKAKPDGKYFLHGNIEEELKPIAVKDLPGIGQSLNERIAEVCGISKRQPTIEDLRKLSKIKLLEIFGQKLGLKLYDFSRGIDDTNINIDVNNSEALLGRKSVSVDVNFGIRFDTIEQVDAFIMNLSKELCSRLANLGICGSSLTLRIARRAKNAPIEPAKYLGMGQCDFTSKSTRLGVPTNDWGLIGSELKAIFRMINIPVKDLRGISITMNKLEDVDRLKKSRQTTLDFSNAQPQSKKRNSDQTDLGKDNPEFGKIDWDVFNALPTEIKAELQLELSRRGIISNNPANSPSPSPRKLKRPPGTKVYLQQLIPNAISIPPTYARVIESPTKSKGKKRPISKSPSPKKAKKQDTAMYNHSSSYDTSVMNELPSSIRKEVLKDLEYMKKIKNFDLVPLKEKISKKLEVRSRFKPVTITAEWLEEQEKLVNSPLFLNKRVTFLDMKRQIEGWIDSSLKQRGPHIEDVTLFVKYIEDLLYQNNLNRCLTIITCIKSNLDYHESIARSSLEDKEGKLLLDGIEDWKYHISHMIIPVVENYCKQNRIDALQ